MNFFHIFLFEESLKCNDEWLFPSWRTAKTQQSVDVFSIRWIRWRYITYAFYIHPATSCVDGLLSSMCKTKYQKTPWIVLKFEKPVRVKRVFLYNTNKQDYDGSLVIPSEQAARRLQKVGVQFLKQISANFKLISAQDDARYKGPGQVGLTYQCTLRKHMMSEALNLWTHPKITLFFRINVFTLYFACLDSTEIN